MSNDVQDAFNALIKLLRATSEEAVPAAEDAGAEVLRQAAEAAAPRETGQLAASVDVIEAKDRKQLFEGKQRRRLFVSPNRKKGYYGYFLEKGWKMPLGPRTTYYKMTGGSARHYQDLGFPGRPFANRRRRRFVRLENPGTHSQQGSTTWKQIPARAWFHPAIKSAESAAEAAGATAFDSKLQEIDGRS